MRSARTSAGWSPRSSPAPELHVLVVDDASPDGTGALADALAAENPRVRVLHRAAKSGLGTAYVDGFHYALREPTRRT